MPLSRYETFKKDMQTGDLLLWSSDSLIGAAIRFFTRSNVNHASMILRFPEYEGAEGRRFTTEALEHGTVLNLLSRRLETHKGEVWWYPLKDEWNPDRNEIGHRALELIGRPYDYKSLFENIACHVSTDAKKLFCSEYYYLSLGLSGKAPRPNDLPGLGIFKPPVQILFKGD